MINNNNELSNISKIYKVIYKYKAEEHVPLKRAGIRCMGGRN